MSNTHQTSETSKLHEIQLTDPEIGNIISTLAKENGWLSDDNHPLYLYQGSWYPGLFIGAIIAAQAQEIPGFALSPSDIVICSVPKSGTTWLKALSFAIATRARFPTEDFENHPLHSTIPHRLMPMIEGNKLNVQPYADLPLYSTHLPYTSLPRSVLASGCKIVYIWRDPKDAFISLWQFSHKIRPNKDVTQPIALEEAFDLFCRGISPFGPYWDHVLGYWKAFLDHPDKMMFLKYEDMMNDVEVNVKRLAEFMGYPFSTEEEQEGGLARIIEMCSFESLSNLAVKKSGDDIISPGSLSLTGDVYYRKGKIGDWKSYLTEEMAHKIDQITADKLGACGLALYRLQSEVDIENVGEEYCCWQRYGGNLSDNSSSSEEPEAASVGWGGSVDLTGTSSAHGNNMGWQWYNDPRLKCLGFRGIFPSNTAPPLVEADQETAEENYLLWRLEKGVAEGPNEIPKGKAIPLEYNLAGLNAISFDKGCYVGQELVARTHHRGVIRKRLVCLKFINESGKEMEQRVAHGSSVINAGSGKKVGSVTTALGSRGLGLVRLDEAFKGSGSGSLAIEGSQDVKVQVIKPDWWPADWARDCQEETAIA